MSSRPDEAATSPPDEVSVADWTAGYEAGYRAGYLAARTALDDAARALAALRPSRALDVTEARAGADRGADQPDHTDPAALAAYRTRIYASWGLPPPTETDATGTGIDARRTA